jgi:uncharacterized membrane protein YkoI
MNRKRTIITAATAVVLVAGGGAAIAAAQQDPGPPELDRATRIALETVGDGSVTDVEQDDDGGYEVEVRRADGTETEVHLDADFTVVRTEPDD